MTKYKLEYIWLDGYTPVPNLRGKTLIKEYSSFPGLEELPLWGFDGSSTQQAEGSNSDCVLKPVAHYPDPARTDGVVILHAAFGTTGTAAAPFGLGRTTTHEVGHWLNLRHIWGDTNDCSGSDQVSDTPRATAPNYGKPDWPHITCNNGPNGDMFMNYMDYVDDAAMFMFTQAQAARMNATLAGPRKKIAGL